MDVEGVIRSVDRFQQGHRALGFPFAVVKKFGDDRCSTLAALFAYYGFLSIFPLLLLLVTGLGIALRSDPELQRRVLESAAGELPIVGSQLTGNIHAIDSRGLPLVFGALGLLWGSLGLAQIGQLAMAQVWNVRGVDRPGFVPRLVRSLLLITVLGTGILLTTALAGIGTGSGGAIGWRLLAGLASILTNLALFCAVFRVLTPKSIDLRLLVPGALLAGFGWTLLQGLGGILVTHQLRHASQVYGTFGLVLGLLSFLSLAGTMTLYAAELNVVLARGLWPRSILQPPLTDGDKAVLAAIAEQEERRPEQVVDVTYEDEPERQPADA